MPSFNHTITYFILKGISDVPRLQVLIFLLVLLIYLITLGGNITTLLLVCLDHHLHTPMYFFLVNLSMIDMFCSTAALHKIFSQNRLISYLYCLTQLFIFCSLTCDQFWILAAMSYDRYVAICKPLYYHIIMRWRCCFLLASVCWVLGFFETVPLAVLLSGFSCFLSSEVDHYFCDVFPLREITCNDVTHLDLYVLIVGLFQLFTSFLLTFVPYIFIISCILHISSNTGRIKAFYTCSSHIVVVLVFYMTITFQYIASTSMNSKTTNKLLALLNTAVVPMLNPLIYSLKNKDIKSALERITKLLLNPKTNILI
ncbi:olfactory receptor 6C1-like [Mantella aurantiaca]